MACDMLGGKMSCVRPTTAYRRTSQRQRQRQRQRPIGAGKVIMGIKERSSSVCRGRTSFKLVPSSPGDTVSRRSKRCLLTSTHVSGCDQDVACTHENQSAEGDCEILDGKAIADTILMECSSRVSKLIQGTGRAPELAVLLVGERKVHCFNERHDLSYNVIISYDIIEGLNLKSLSVSIMIRNEKMILSFELNT